MTIAEVLRLHTGSREAPSNHGLPKGMTRVQSAKAPTKA
jgi:hypothetical protein